MNDKPKQDFGNAEWCPQDPTHGHLYEIGRGSWCPNSRHKGSPFYPPAPTPRKGKA